MEGQQAPGTLVRWQRQGDWSVLFPVEQVLFANSAREPDCFFIDQSGQLIGMMRPVFWNKEPGMKVPGPQDGIGEVVSGSAFVSYCRPAGFLSQQREMVRRRSGKN